MTEPRDDFPDEEPTAPIPHETLAEVSERWLAAQAAGVPSCERPTRNIRPLKKPIVPAP